MSTIEIGAPAESIPGGHATRVKEAAYQREQKKGALAQAKRENRSKKAGGDVHQVARKVGQSRTQEAKAAHKVDRGPVKRWRRAHALPSFQDPPGHTLCWIARHRRRHGDEAGVIAAIREGWEFVQASELDEDDLPTETLTGRLARHGEVIGNDSSVLMKLADELKEQRDTFYNNRRDAATRQVTKKRPGLAEATPQMPLVEDRNDISVENVRMRARRPSKREDSDT